MQAATEILARRLRELGRPRPNMKLAIEARIGSEGYRITGDDPISITGNESAGCCTAREEIHCRTSQRWGGEAVPSICWFDGIFSSSG